MIKHIKTSLPRALGVAALLPAAAASAHHGGPHFDTAAAASTDLKLFAAVFAVALLIQWATGALRRVRS